MEAIVHRGKANARTVTRARILLNSADGWSTAATRVGVGCVSGDRDERAATLRGIGGLEAVLHDKVQQHRESRSLWVTDGPSDRCRL